MWQRREDRIATLVMYKGVWHNFFLLGRLTYVPLPTPAEFYLAENAYPFNFIKNMINNNSSFFSEKAGFSTNVTVLFFYNLCTVYKQSHNTTLNFTNENSTEINNSIKEMASSYIPTDNFTKQLYSEYVTYSKSCSKPGTAIQNSSFFIKTYCSGGPDNYTFPNPLDFSAFYQSLYDYMQFQKNTTTFYHSGLLKLTNVEDVAENITPVSVYSNNTGYSVPLISIGNSYYNFTATSVGPYVYYHGTVYSHISGYNDTVYTSSYENGNSATEWSYLECYTDSSNPCKLDITNVPYKEIVNGYAIYLNTYN